MNAAALISFNLLVNSLCSFTLSLLLVYGVLRAFRIPPGRCRLWLLLLPVVKVLVVLGAGVPESSFLWAKLAGQTQELGSFKFGLGLRWFWPVFWFELSAISHGLMYPQSLGDVLQAGLSKHVGSWLPPALAAFAISIGASRACWHGAKSQIFLRRILKTAQLIERRKVGRRDVAVWQSAGYTGAPFAAGLWHAHVVFPVRSLTAFDASERAAALQHELAHIAHRDPILLFVLSVFDDLFWFLPGLRGLLARIHAVIEQRADDSTIAAGTDSVALAAALVRTAELSQTTHPTLAMLGTPSLLALRVQRLLTPQAAASRKALVGQIVLSAILTFAIVDALFFGNHAAALTRIATP
jgi:Zn-dependent protease with chaperone function